MSDDIIDFYKKVIDQVAPDNTTSDDIKITEISADPFQHFLHTLAENIEKTEPKEFKQVEEQETITDPFAKFLSSMASIVKEDKKVQTDEQIKEATIGFINKLKSTEEEVPEVITPVVKKLPKKAKVDVVKKQKTPSFNLETGLPEIQEQKITEPYIKKENSYVKELSLADKNKKIPDKIAKATDIKSIIEKQVREAVNKLRQEFGQTMMSSGGGTVAVQYADGGTMNGDLNVTGKYLSGGRDLAAIFTGGGGGQSDRLIAGSESFILNSNGTLTIPNDTIRLEDDTNLILESESSPLQAPLTGTLYNRLFLSPYGFFAYDNNSNSITIDSVGNDITLTTLDSNDWIFRDDGTLVGPGSALTVRGDLSSLGRILSGDRDLADIFLTTETDSQTLTYTPSSFELSISNGNTISLASLSSVPTDLSFLSVSGNWNTAYASTTALNLSSSIWNSVYTTVQTNSGSWGSGPAPTTSTDSFTVQIELPDNKDYILDARAAYLYTLSAVHFYALSGSGNLSLEINNIIIPEFNQRTIANTLSTIYLTNNNVISGNQTFTAMVSNNSFMNDLIIDVVYTR